MPEKKDFTGDPGGLIGAAIWSTIKPLHREAKRQERAAHSPRRSYYAPEPKVSQKEIVFEVLPQAIRNAGEHFSARDLFYAVRPLAYAYPDWDADKELNYTYFSQQLLTEYQEAHGPIDGLWRDPRGHLHQPHPELCPLCGAGPGALPLGTREVAAYQFPEHAFDKILYVEKEGEWPKLQAARLAERYDMAIASAKGYPVEAVRELFRRAERGKYQLFVFHDADLDGYNIARVMAEETRRMPDYSVDVIDIGLTVEDALEMGLDSEPFYRSKDISFELKMKLSAVAKQLLYQREPHGKGVRGKRFELNAILPDTRRIEYIERKLKENGIRGKVIPPDDALTELREAMYREKVEGWIEEIIAEVIDTDALKDKIVEDFEERFGLDGAREWIEQGFEDDRSKSWRSVLEERLEKLHEGNHKGDMSDAVREHVRKCVFEEDV